MSSLPLFFPFIPADAAAQTLDVLQSRWIGQGPRVDEFEELFARRICGGRTAAVAVGAGTDALHLAYRLAGIGEGDEVIAPVFTCVASTMPLLYQGARLRFADIQRETLNIDPESVRRLVTPRTKAISCTHYAGLPCDMDELLQIASEHGIVVIEDAAHALGADYKGIPVGAISDFTIFSFQAIKHITTGDGGMLMLKDSALVERARRMRWFGIDRKAKQLGAWDNEITEVGYKYQMTDLAAALGIAGLEHLEQVLDRRRALLACYATELSGIPGISVIGQGFNDRTHAAWLCTVLVEDRAGFQAKLAQRGIESDPVHYRNDRYAVFKQRAERTTCPNMDQIESNYLVLPLHMRVTEDDIAMIAKLARDGW